MCSNIKKPTLLVRWKREAEAGDLKVVKKWTESGEKWYYEPTEIWLQIFGDSRSFIKSGWWRSSEWEFVEFICEAWNLWNWLKSVSSLSFMSNVCLSSALCTKCWRSCRRRGLIPGRRNMDKSPQWVTKLNTQLFASNRGSVCFSVNVQKSVHELNWKSNIHVMLKYFIRNKSLSYCSTATLECVLVQ